MAKLRGGQHRGVYLKVVNKRATTAGLTEREMQVINFIMIGYRNKEIANILGISEGTVKNYINNIFKALKVTTRMEAAIAIRNLGLTPKDKILPHTTICCPNCKSEIVLSYTAVEGI